MAAQFQKFFIGTVAFKDKIKQDDEAMQPLILHSFNFCCVSDRVQASQLSPLSLGQAGDDCFLQALQLAERGGLKPPA